MLKKVVKAPRKPVVIAAFWVGWFEKNAIIKAVSNPITKAPVKLAAVFRLENLRQYSEKNE